MQYANLQQISKILNLTPQMVNRHVKFHGMPRIGRGQYDLLQSVHWYIDFLKRGQDEERKAKIMLEELRLLRARAEKYELYVAERRRELVRIVDIVHILEQGFSAIKSTLMGIPKTAARELGSKEIEQYLEQLIRRALDELSSIPNKLNGNTQPPEQSPSPGVLDSQTAPKAHHKRVGRSVSSAQQRGKRRKRKVANKPR